MCILLTGLLGEYAARSLSHGSGVSASGRLQQLAVDAFLATYVRPDGRVYRPDQGGDTVSEGQAYGLLLAEVAGRDDLVLRIWRWTRVHLQVPDGLFAWHANASGQILDPESAGDADLLIAWSLLRYTGPGAAGLHQDGRRVASAVLAHEVTTAGGIPVLTAGPWASGRPFTVDPSYWSLPALTGLASLTGNKEWLRMADGAVALIARMTRDGALLPPDWAELFPSGQVRPEPAPYDAGPQAQYGLDAQRVTVWFATSCVPQAGTLAARWWRLLRPASHSSALALTPDGAILNPTSSVLPLVAAAAAAQAADDAASTCHLLSLADSLQRHDPRYYGGAWVALGSVLLGSHLLSGC